MELIHAVILALIQGVTEFLPISSSGHLILPAALLGWPDQGLAFDTAVHLGSLAAVVIYFRADISRLAIATTRFAVNREVSDDSRLAGNLLLASLPIIPVGYYSRMVVEAELRHIGIIAFTTIFFGILLWIADHRRKEDKTILTPGSALMIGVAQCFALIPGTSRSGVTMTAALLAGYSREYAAKISLLISIPTIAGAAALKLVDILGQELPVDWTPLIAGTVIAGVSAYACIALLLKLVQQIGYLPFVLYRLLLGAILVLIII